MPPKLELLEDIRDRLIELIKLTEEPDLKKIYDSILQKISLHIGEHKKLDKGALKAAGKSGEK